MSRSCDLNIPSTFMWTNCEKHFMWVELKLKFFDNLKRLSISCTAVATVSDELLAKLTIFSLILNRDIQVRMNSNIPWISSGYGKCLYSSSTDLISKESLKEWAVIIPYDFPPFFGVCTSIVRCILTASLRRFETNLTSWDNMTLASFPFCVDALLVWLLLLLALLDFLGFISLKLVSFELTACFLLELIFGLL